MLFSLSKLSLSRCLRVKHRSISSQAHRVCLGFFSPLFPPLNFTMKLQDPPPQPGDGFRAAGVQQPLRGEVPPAPGCQQQRALRGGLRRLQGDHLPTTRRRHLPRAHPHHLSPANGGGSLGALRGGPSRAPRCSPPASRGPGEAGGCSGETYPAGHHPPRASVCSQILLHIFFPMDTSVQLVPFWETVDILS